MPLPDGQPARLMVVAAHPADAFDNTGGTCAEHIAQGDHVTVVICTCGIHVHNERLRDELRKPEAERDPAIISETAEDHAERKMQEARESLGCFGITDVVLFTFDDLQSELNPRMIDGLEKMIRDRKPHILMMQDPENNLAVRDDHALIGAATWQAIQGANQVRYGDPRPPWIPVEIYVLGVFGINAALFTRQHRRVDVFVDVTKHVEAKVKAHQFLASQGQDRGWGQKRFEAIEGHAGMFAGASYAECFARFMPPICNTLPVCRQRYEDHQLASAESFRKTHQLLGAFVREADGSFAWGHEPDAAPARG